ncbi:Ig-like domain-containing protein [Candidatus Shapirobacteria bacterium]|nr:Ig-like domain-containing protein [Candidatus Shapirobacteria bacterium]
MTKLFSFLRSINKTAIIVAIIIIIIMATYLANHLEEPLSLIETTPKNSQENVSLDTEIILTFNQPINDQQLLIRTEPFFEYQVKKQGNKAIIIPSHPLVSGQRYYLYISYGQNKEELVFFSTIEKSRQQVNPKTIDDSKIAEDMDQYIKENYPLLGVTPKKTANWTADYLSKKKLIITYKKGLYPETIRQEVFAWIKSFGLDPNSHEYIWEEK